jgi:tetratricopeptide (TPR) repeat protein
MEENRMSSETLTENEAMYFRCYKDLMIRHSSTEIERALTEEIFKSIMENDLDGLEQRVLSSTRHPLTPHSCILLTMVYFAKGQYSSGYEMLDKALCLDTTFVPAENILGEVRILERNVPEAIATFERSIRLDPDQFQARHMLADFYRQLGKHEDVLRVLTPVIDMMPESPDLWIWLRESHEALGTILLFQNELLDATERHPNCYMVWFHLGYHYLSISRLQEALDAFRKASILSPDNAGILSNIGATLQRMGNLEASVQYFRRATRLQPDHVSAWMNLVSVLYLLDRQDDEYQEALERVVELDPNIMKQATFYRLDDGVGVPAGFRGEE